MAYMGIPEWDSSVDYGLHQPETGASVHGAAQNGRTWFAPPDFADQPEGEREWFSSMQVIYNPRSVRTPLAVLRADIDARHVVSLAENTSVTENGILLLLRENEIL